MAWQDSTNGSLSEIGQIQKRLGKRIQVLREQKGWTRQRLAEASAIDAAGMQKVESGEFDLSVGTIVRIAQSLGITAEELLRGIA